MRAWCVGLVLVTWGTTAFAQAPLAPDASHTSEPAATAPGDANSIQAGKIFRSGVDLVSLNVVVTDAQEKFVKGLSVADFAVFEDGIQQDVAFFAASSVPIDLAIVLDTSASMTERLHTVQQAAIGFASTVRPGDRVMVVDVKDGVKITHPLSEDVPGAHAAISATSARGGTALYNGLYMTLKDLMRRQRTAGEVRRAAIVVLSDGDDTASLVGFDDVMETAKQSGVAIYTIALQSPYLIRHAKANGNRHFSESEFAMKALARETGARAFSPAEISELAGVYETIADELANQYALGYTSTNRSADGAYRRVVVRVTAPGARTRTRTGYVATSATRSYQAR